MNMDFCNFMQTLFALSGGPNRDGTEFWADVAGVLALTVLWLGGLWLGYGFGFSPETEAVTGGPW